MGLTAAAAYWFLPVVIPIAIFVSWSDMKRMKITNQSMMVLFAAFVVTGPFALGFPDYFWHLLHGPIVLVIGMALWALRLMGGGDAKMYAAMSPYFAVADWFLILMVFTAAAFAGVITHSLFRFTPLRRLAPDWESWTARRSDLRGGLFGLDLAFPKGLVLSMTLLFYLILVAVYR
ncbi:prepilin peptidase [Cognatiyoonia sp. IB215446]|uniref:A24 family peptidase n=1 Tax=Cognatiyoonia sp. IB215446 TaxID=3097355 RepID=UPI002A10E98D|nr:prepilin peptidase [Cognatiyoonia sp. IB215446]MDX8347268.1 prepilin peptidase [Cognatiyoonia sp. IB215446]